MKKYLKETKKITIQPYDVTLVIIETNSRKKAIKFFKKTDPSMDWDNYFEYGMFAQVFEGLYKTEKGKDHFCIYLVLNRNNKPTKLTYGTIAHECHHVIDFVYERIGAKMDSENPEPTTYLLGWLVDEVLKALGVDANIGQNK